MRHDDSAEAGASEEQPQPSPVPASANCVGLFRGGSQAVRCCVKVWLAVPLHGVRGPTHGVEPSGRTLTTENATSREGDRATGAPSLLFVSVIPPASSAKAPPAARKGRAQALAGSSPPGMMQRAIRETESPAFFLALLTLSWVRGAPARSPGEPRAVLARPPARRRGCPVARSGSRRARRRRGSARSLRPAARAPFGRPRRRLRAAPGRVRERWADGCLRRELRAPGGALNSKKDVGEVMTASSRSCAASGSSIR
jgi:hypothetical protein